jgi:hypothetical protein
MLTNYRHMPRSTARLLSSSGAALALSCSLLVGLTGCGEDKAQQAIDEAARTLAAINAGAGGRQLSVDTVYERVRTGLGSLPGSASDSQKAAASLLIAQAERGLAEREATQAAIHMGEAMRLLGPAEAELRSFMLNTSRAADAQSYNPAPLLADLTQRRAQAQAQSARLQAEIAAQEQLAAQLNQQVATLRAQADEFRLKAADLQSQATAGGPTAGLPSAQAAHEARRAADGIALQAQAIEQDAMAAARAAAELEIEGQKFTEQIQALDLAQESVVQRQQSTQAEATAARQAAEQAASLLQATLSGEGGLDALHASIIPASFEPAIRGYEASIRTAQSARAEQRGSASLAIALANQSLANLHSSRAEGLLGYVAVLEAAAREGVPGAQAFTTRAQQARERAAEHVQAAATAYDAAIENYEASGAQGEAKSTRDSLSARLGELRALVLDQQVAPESFSPIDRTNTDEAGDAAPAGDDGEGGDDAALRGALREFQEAIATQDSVRATSFLHPAGPQEESLIASLSDMAARSARLDAATETAFGQKFSAWSAENPQAMGPLGAMDNSEMMAGPLGGVDVESLDLRVSGDEAVAMLDDGSSVDLIRVDGTWKMLFSLEAMGLPPEAQQGMAMMEQMSAQMGMLVDSMTARVESGELTSNQAVAVVMVGEVMNAMRQMMGGQGGGG